MLSVHLLPGGDQVKGQATLDLCNQTFPSESLRVQRLQDVAVDSSGAGVLSTEAVLYQNAAATKQAFKELRGVRASCPKGPVTSADGTKTTTTFQPPRIPSGLRRPRSGVRRSPDHHGREGRERGVPGGVPAARPSAARRLLLKADDPQPAIDGHTKPADIVNAFATRVAQLPASFVADPTR